MTNIRAAKHKHKQTHFKMPFGGIVGVVCANCSEASTRQLQINRERAGLLMVSLVAILWVSFIILHAMEYI